MTLTVSVLVTFYNQACYVDRALKSVFDQKADFSIEVVVGDDGSTDGTMDKLGKWVENYPSLVRVFQWARDSATQYEPIARVSENRMRLAKKARGCYLVFLDGDDYFSDSLKLARQVEALEAHPECCCCFHNMANSRDAGGGGTFAPLWLREGVIPFRVYWALLYVHAEAFMFRAEEGMLAGADPENFDDNTIVFTLARNGSMYYIPEVMAVYDQSEEGSWLARGEERRFNANLSDFIYEQRLSAEFADESVMRHIKDLRRLVRDAMNSGAPNRGMQNVKGFLDLADKRGGEKAFLLEGVSVGLRVRLLVLCVRKKLMRWLLRVRMLALGVRTGFSD